MINLLIQLMLLHQNWGTVACHQKIQKTPQNSSYFFKVIPNDLLLIYLQLLDGIISKKIILGEKII